MKTLFTTVALISLAASALMPVTALTARAAEQAMPEYHQTPQNIEEFNTEYNKVLAFLRSTEVQPAHKCNKAADDPGSIHDWCGNWLRWGNPKGDSVAAGENKMDDGTVINFFCSGHERSLQRCCFSDGRVVDQTFNMQTRVWVTYRQVVAKWGERGTPLSDLKTLNQPQDSASPKQPEVASPSLPEAPHHAE
jgi:hypothetical protein